MSEHTCKQCGRSFQYIQGEEVGYSRDLCGPFCDGLYTGLASRATNKREMVLARSLLEADARLDYANIGCSQEFSLACQLAREILEEK